MAHAYDAHARAVAGYYQNVTRKKEEGGRKAKRS